MRTLEEIITAAKEGQPPSYEECFYAMVVLSNLVSFSVQDWKYLLRLDAKQLTGSAGVEFQAEMAFQRYEKALGASPKEWPDWWNNDPPDPDYQKWRKAVDAIFDKMTGERC